MKYLKISLFSLSILVYFSCTPEKRFVYLQEKKQSGQSQNSNETKPFEYIIKPYDVLFIKTVSMSEGNFLSTSTENTPNVLSTDMGIYMNSYNVNDSGFIDLPILGKVKMSGFSVTQCQRNLQILVEQYLKNVLVIVKLVNFNVTILGEVSRPGIYRIYNPEINILEAIGQAGDLTINGNRERIMLIRQDIPGKAVYLDLTDKNLINSNYYYLLPGDIIYVKPNKAKFFGTNPFPVATMLSTITTLILVLNYIKK